MVDKWTLYYASHPDAMQRMATRAGKYLYYIVDEINRRGLPTGACAALFVESAYNPYGFVLHAKARTLAVHPQHRERVLRLKQDWWRGPAARSDRFNQRRRTRLPGIPVRFSRRLVSCARLVQLGAKARSSGPWFAIWRPASPLTATALSMPDETRNYVPKLQAIKNIVADLERFAVVLPVVDNEPYFVSVEENVSMDFHVAAQLAEMPIEDFQALNPSFNQPIIVAQQEHEVILPRDKVDIFNANLAEYKGELTSWKIYRRRAKPSPRSPTSSAYPRRACEANAIPASTRNASDQALLIPGPPARASASAPSGRSASAPARGKSTDRVRTHVVRKGESLDSIARQYGTTNGNAALSEQHQRQHDQTRQ